MSIVKNFNGAEPGTDSENMVKYSFNGSPNSLYEHETMPEVGEYRVMTLTVECTSSGDKKNRDGKYPAASWAVREAQIGRQIDPPPPPEKKSKSKKDDEDTPDVDENQGGLFDEPADTGEAGADEPATDGAELPEGPEWGDDDNVRVDSEPTKAFSDGPTFSSIEGGRS